MNGIVNAPGVTKIELDVVQTAVNDHVSDSGNPHGVTKEQIGLGKVDNTADKDKPVSTAQQAALNAHAGNTTIHVTADERKRWNSQQNALTFDSTPTAGSSNPVTSDGIKAAIDSLNAATDGDLTAHTGNTTVHITAAERKKWNAKQNALTFDAEPTKGSENVVTSGAVFQAIQEVTMPIWYVSRKPVSFTLAKGNWNGTTYSLTIPDTYKMVDEYVQVGVPSQSSEANTEQLIKSAITVSVSDTTNPITLTAVTAPTTDVIIAVFGLEEKTTTSGGTTA